MGWKEQVSSRLKLRINQRTVVMLLLIALLGAVTFMTMGGSTTDPFNWSQNQPTYRGDPNKYTVPPYNATNFNYTEDFPSVSLPSGFTDIPTLPTFPSDDPHGTATGTTGSDQTNTGPGFPTSSLPPISPGPGPIQTIFTPPDWTITFGGGDPGGVDQGTNDPLDVPERPNKAKNLFNLSGVKFLPEINFNFVRDFTSNINIPIASIVFVSLILGTFYYSRIGIGAILMQLDREEYEEGEENSLFFVPSQSEAELRRIEERKKKLIEFADFVEEIIAYLQEHRDDKLPEELIVHSYYQLDYAFSVFHQLERTKDITPLEHASLQFESGEINNFSLLNIVDLFYRTRFGKREMDTHHIDELISYLQSLIILQDISEEEKKRRFFL